MILAMAATLKRDQRTQKNVFHQCICFMLVSMKTFLLLPFLDIVMRTIKAEADNGDSTVSSQLVTYLICSFALLSFFTVQAYLMRLFNVHSPTDLIPWCEPISHTGSLTLIIQTVLVICNVFDPEGSQVLVELLILFVLMAALSLYRLLFKPMYTREVDLFVKLTEVTLLLVYFVGIVCKAIGDTQYYVIIYFLVSFPFAVCQYTFFERARKLQVIQKIKSRTLKLESECEYALYIVMELVKESLDETIVIQKSFGELIDLMNGHVEDCDDPSCICNELENFYDLLMLRSVSSHQAETLVLREGYSKYIKIIEDHGLIGTISSITETTSRNRVEMAINLSNEEQNEEEQMQKDLEEGTQKLFSIELTEIKRRFLAGFLHLYCLEIIRKFPEGLQLQFLQYHYAIHFMRKETLCSFQLSRFPVHKMGFSDQVRHVVTQQYTIMHINELQQADANFIKQKHWIGNLNGDYFIKMNTLQRRFDSSIDSICATVTSFWQGFIKEQVNPEETIAQGSVISSSIQEFFKIFEEIDTLQTVKDHQLYFKFAMLQQHVLNDAQSYDHYIAKMKSILEVNEVFKKTVTSDSVASSNLIVVKADSSQFGNILQVNQNLRLVLGWSEDELKSMTIEQIMPQPIMQKHNAFIKKFQVSGETFIIKKKTTVFIKKKNGYVIPVELFISFYYSIDFEYTYLVVIKPIQNMIPFKNGVTYNTDQLLFMIVENEKYGHVYDYSDSSIKLLQNQGINPQSGLIRKITELLPDLDFDSFFKSREERYANEQVYEREHLLDISIFQDHDASQYCMRANNNQVQRFAPVLTRIFEERFCGGLLDINIFCFSFQESHINSKINEIHNKKLNIKNMRLDEETENERSENILKNYVTQKHEHEDSITGSSNDSSGSGTQTNLAEFRSFHSVSDQTTPLTLILIMRLIAILYTIMIVVASVSLGINQLKQNQTVVDINTMTNAYNRMNWGAQNLGFTRVLANIANGLSSNSSNIDPNVNRFSRYRSLLVSGITQYQYYTSELQRSSFSQSQAFTHYEATQNVNVSFLSDANQVYTMNETIAVAVNSYINRLITLSGYQSQDLVGHVIGMQIIPAKDPYSPSPVEQLIYSILQNSVNGIRNADLDDITLYGRDSHDHATASTQIVLITCIISIIAILCIGLVIAPMLTQTEFRRFKCLNYFIKIPKDKISNMVKSCQYCAAFSDESTSVQIMKEHQNILGVTLISDQQKTLLKQDVNNKTLKIKNEDLKFPNSISDSNGSYYSSSSSSVINQIMPTKYLEKGKELANNPIPEQIIALSRKSENRKNSISSQDLQQGSEDSIQLQLRYNLQIIRKTVFRKRFFMAFSVITVLILLTTYFIISYYLSIQTFNTAQTINNPIEAILYKGACFDQTIAYMRGNIMLNTTQMSPNVTDGLLNADDSGAIDDVKQYLVICRGLEQEYFSYLVDTPPYLSSASQLMKNVESEHICDILFVGSQLGGLNTLCNNAMNGILKVGLTNTFVYMFRILEGIDMQFDNYGPTINRTEAVLLSMAQNKNLKDMQDMRTFLIEPLLQILKTELTQSIVNYIQTQLSNFLIAYVIFIVLLTIGMAFLATVGFQKLKKNMLDTNIMLRIIPFESLGNEDREEVVQFFRN